MSWKRTLSVAANRRVEDRTRSQSHEGASLWRPVPRAAPAKNSLESVPLNFSHSIARATLDRTQPRTNRPPVTAPGKCQAPDHQECDFAEKCDAATHLISASYRNTPQLSENKHFQVPLSSISYALILRKSFPHNQFRTAHSLFSCKSPIFNVFPKSYRGCGYPCRPQT
jgi:hypothetical protein